MECGIIIGFVRFLGFTVKNILLLTANTFVIPIFFRSSYLDVRQRQRCSLYADLTLNLFIYFAS